MTLYLYIYIVANDSLMCYGNGNMATAVLKSNPDRPRYICKKWQHCSRIYINFFHFTHKNKIVFNIKMTIL